AMMVRGEFIPVIGALPRREALATRVAASLHQLVRSCATASAGIGAVVAMAIVIGGLAAAGVSDRLCKRRRCCCYSDFNCLMCVKSVWVLVRGSRSRTGVARGSNP